MNEIICGNSLEIVATLPHARMIFADPPDNIGMTYSDYDDLMEHDDYCTFLSMVRQTGIAHSEVCWLSYYYKYYYDILKDVQAWEITQHNWHQFIWRFTFGQHRTNDCGNGYRPILRVSTPCIEWNTDSIRVESARQRLGDSRANPEGRVPDDVWEFPRVVGNAKERRPWISNQHPEALIERMILMSTKPGDLVIDMFAGSGTVHRVCRRLKRDSYSIDISPDYCERIESESRG